MTSPTRPRDGELVEVADRCWVARHDFLDVNVSVVAGDDGLLVVDSHASEAAAARLLDRLRAVPALRSAPVAAVVNTHAHYDHVLGNRVLTDASPDVALWAHEEAVTAMPEAVQRFLDQGEAPMDHPEEMQEVRRSRLQVPERTFSSAAVVDLGDRVVELVHLGRGHTDGDCVVVVPDAATVLAGDLVEESGPPVYGPDSFPLDWPGTLDLLLGMLDGSSTVVPGHGAPVGRDFVLEQRGDVGMVAEQARSLAGQGVPVAEALAAGEWPFPAEGLGEAVRRAYQQLPREGRSLPLA